MRESYRLRLKGRYRWRTARLRLVSRRRRRARRGAPLLRCRSWSGQRHRSAHLRRRRGRCRALTIGSRVRRVRAAAAAAGIRRRCPSRSCCSALAGLLLLVGIETTAPPTAGDLRAGDLAGTTGSASRRTRPSRGRLPRPSSPTSYDGDEHERAWFYLLVDPTARRGITVALGSAADRGVHLADDGASIVEDPEYVEDDIDYFKGDTDELGLTLDPKVYIDATAAPATRPNGSTSAPAPPADGTVVEVSGSRLVDYWPTCLEDPERRRQMRRRRERTRSTSSSTTRSASTRSPSSRGRRRRSPKRRSPGC